MLPKPVPVHILCPSPHKVKSGCSDANCVTCAYKRTSGLLTQSEDRSENPYFNVIRFTCISEKDTEDCKLPLNDIILM